MLELCALSRERIAQGFDKCKNVARVFLKNPLVNVTRGFWGGGYFRGNALSFWSHPTSAPAEVQAKIRVGFSVLVDLVALGLGQAARFDGGCKLGF